MIKLTQRQEMILNVIRDRVGEFGYPPSLRELCVILDLRSTHGVSQHLDALERKGYIKRSRNGASRGIKLVEKIAASSEVQTVKVYSRAFEEGNVVDTIKVVTSDNMAGYQVSGDALASVGILSGDYLLVRRGVFVPLGALVCLQVNNEDPISVRRYYREKDYVRFEAVSAETPTILVHHVNFKSTVIIGVASSVYRKY